MDVENPLINSPVEIEKNMLITVVGKGSIQNRFLVLSKTDTNILLGYYEYDLVKHPEMLASHSACMERLSFMNNHKGLRHTTPKQKGECRDCLTHRWDEYISQSNEDWVEGDKVVRKIIRSIC